MKPLVIIPARGGSKGIPHKNIRPFAGQPLIWRAIDTARAITDDAHICVSTDDPEIAETVRRHGLEVPFMRPDYLAADNSGTYEVLLHALDYYESRGEKFDCIILLQPTSPFRTPVHVKEALALYTPGCDMVVSAKEADANPYYNLFEETGEGYLRLSKGDGSVHRRQDAPKAWQYNGAVYIINPESLRRSPLSKFERCIKYEMDPISSLDLDTPLDWEIAELIASRTTPPEPERPVAN